MTKKIVLLFVMFMLSFAGSSAVVLANDSIGQLDDQAETEGVAGITWDEINEMAQNSPNALNPIQGLVLWMFAILAFLKLAQKMDSMLQSLGLNVTQTGGRALGDLVMAGMAIKHIGSAVSKGMGMFGMGGSGGGSGGGSSGGSSGSSGAGGGSSSGGGSAPIPTGPGGSPTPAGGSPGSGSPGGNPTPGGAPIGGATPPGSPSGNPPSGGTPSGSTPTGGTGDSENPGNSADGNNADSFARGALKAGAKGGLIGLGIYSTKAGVAKIGEAISARNAGEAVSSGDSDEPPIGSNPYNSENSEEYQTTRPIDGTDDQTLIPTSYNSEEYNDSGHSDESGSPYSSYNDEEYTNVDPNDSTVSPIPTTIEGGQGSETESDETAQVFSSDDGTGETWQESRPVNTGATPIPSSVNNEEWQGGNPSNLPTATGTGGEPPQPLINAPVASSSQTDGEGISHQPIPSNVPTSINPGSATETGAASATAGFSTPPQSTVISPANSDSAQVVVSGGSHEDVAVNESLSSGDDSSESAVSQSNYGGTGNPESYDSAPVSSGNQSISGEIPQSTMPSGVSQDSYTTDNNGAEITASGTVPQTPIPASGDVNTLAHQTETGHSMLVQNHSDAVRGDSQIQGSTAVTAEPPPAAQINAAAMPTQPTTQVMNVETPGHEPPPVTVKNETAPTPPPKPQSAFIQGFERGVKKRKK